MPKFNEAPIEEIYWIDSFGSNGWDNKEDYEASIEKTSMQIRSVGFLVFESADRVALVLSEGEHAYNGQICIPKVSITARRRLS